jgi:uncharacterized protein YbjQ (UPF0145 family)
MKIKEIAKNNDIDPDKFEKWLRDSGVEISSGFTGNKLDESLNGDQLANDFKKYMADEKAAAKKEKEEAAKAANEAKAAVERSAQEKQQGLASMLITSGFNFDGYTITKYSGYISGDDAVSMDRPTQGWLGGVSSDVGGDLLSGLSGIRRNALAELKEQAYALGCNAVIGVDFDYITMDPETVNSGGGTLYLPFLFAVTANGNAVVIEKNN